MDNGASSYRRFLEGDDDGIVEIIKDHKDGLMLYLNSFVQNIHLAEDLTEDTFVKLIAKRTAPVLWEKHIQNLAVFHWQECGIGLLAKEH